MSTKEFYLYVGTQKIAVSKEIYDAYYKEIEKGKYEQKKKRQFKVISYNSLDSDDALGEETLIDKDAALVEDLAIRRLLIKKLRSSLTFLEKEEAELVAALFYRGYSLRGWSQETGVPVMTLEYRKRQILLKLKNLLEN